MSEHYELIVTPQHIEGFDDALKKCDCGITDSCYGIEWHIKHYRGVTEESTFVLVVK